MTILSLHMVDSFRWMLMRVYKCHQALKKMHAAQPMKNANCKGTVLKYAKKLLLLVKSN